MASDQLTDIGLESIRLIDAKPRAIPTEHEVEKDLVSVFYCNININVCLITYIYKSILVMRPWTGHPAEHPNDTSRYFKNQHLGPCMLVLEVSMNPVLCWMSGPRQKFMHKVILFFNEHTIDQLKKSLSSQRFCLY